MKSNESDVCDVKFWRGGCCVRHKPRTHDFAHKVFGNVLWSMINVWCFVEKNTDLLQDSDMGPTSQMGQW